MIKRTSNNEHGAVAEVTSARLTRRHLAQALAACGSAAICIKPSRATAEDSEAAVPTLQLGDRFAVIPDSGPLHAIKLADLAPGQAIMGGYPIDPTTGLPRTDTRLNMINVVRLAGDHKHLAATSGVAVFSAICTHKACAVSSWQPENNHWRCFCHMSEFDAANKGERVEGPAVDALPMVPITIDAEGYIVAAGGFSAQPGATG